MQASEHEAAEQRPSQPDGPGGQIMARARAWLEERGLSWEVTENGMHSGSVQIANMRAEFILQAVEEEQLLGATVVLPLTVPYPSEKGFLRRMKRLTEQVGIHPETRDVSVRVVVALESDLPLPSHSLMEEIFEHLETLSLECITAWQETLAGTPSTWNLTDRMRVELPIIDSVDVDWSISVSADQEVEADSEEEAIEAFEDWFHGTLSDDGGPEWDVSIYCVTATLEDGTEEELDCDDSGHPERQWVTSLDLMTRVVRLGVASHPKTPPDVLERLATEDPAPGVRDRAARPRREPAEPEGKARKRASLDRVLMGLAREPGRRDPKALEDDRVPAELLRLVASTPDLGELAHIARNPACPPDLLRALAQVGA